MTGWTVTEVPGGHGAGNRAESILSDLPLRAGLQLSNQFPLAASQPSMPVRRRRKRNILGL